MFKVKTMSIMIIFACLSTIECTNLEVSMEMDPSTENYFINLNELYQVEKIFTKQHEHEHEHKDKDKYKWPKYEVELRNGKEKPNIVPEVYIKFMEKYGSCLQQELSKTKDAVQLLKTYGDIWNIFKDASATFAMEWEKIVPLAKDKVSPIFKEAIRLWEKVIFEKTNYIPQAVMELIEEEIKGGHKHKHTGLIPAEIAQSYEMVGIIKEYTDFIGWHDENFEKFMGRPRPQEIKKVELAIAEGKTREVELELEKQGRKGNNMIEFVKPYYVGLAMMRGHKETFELVLEKVKRKGGSLRKFINPVYVGHAIMNGQVGVLELVFEKAEKEKIDLEDIIGHHYVGTAMMRGHKEIFELVLENVKRKGGSLRKFINPISVGHTIINGQVGMLELVFEKAEKEEIDLEDIIDHHYVGTAMGRGHRETLELVFEKVERKGGSLRKFINSVYVGYTIINGQVGVLELVFKKAEKEEIDLEDIIDHHDIGKAIANETMGTLSLVFRELKRKNKEIRRFVKPFWFCSAGEKRHKEALKLVIKEVGEKFGKEQIGKHSKDVSRVITEVVEEMGGSRAEEGRTYLNLKLEPLSPVEEEPERKRSRINKY